MEIRILRYDTIDSTNSEALRQAKMGAAEGLCIVADEQAAGRGRHGRVWVSEKDSGLYFSILLRPSLPSSLLPLITLMSAVSVHDALLRFAVDADIKWVNDLLVSEKKICGILAEATDTPDGLAVVVGIGINLTAGNHPPEIASTATSIESETGLTPNKTRITEHLVDALISNYGLLCGEVGPSTIRELWCERSSYAEGKKIVAKIAGETITGVTRGIEENGALRLELGDGSIRTLQAGEIERIRTTSAES